MTYETTPEPLSLEEMRIAKIAVVTAMDQLTLSTNISLYAQLEALYQRLRNLGA